MPKSNIWEETLTDILDHCIVGQWDPNCTVTWEVVLSQLLMMTPVFSVPTLTPNAFPGTRSPIWVVGIGITTWLGPCFAGLTLSKVLWHFCNLHFMYRCLRRDFREARFNTCRDYIPLDICSCCRDISSSSVTTVVCGKCFLYVYE